MKNYFIFHRSPKQVQYSFGMNFFISKYIRTAQYKYLLKNYLLVFVTVV